MKAFLTLTSEAKRDKVKEISASVILLSYDRKFILKDG